MAQTPAERRRAQRQLAKEQRAIREGRATRQRGAAGRAYRREIERRDLPVFRQERQRLIGGGPSEGPRTPPGGGGGIDRQDLEDQYVAKMEALFHDAATDYGAWEKFDRASVRDNAESMSIDELLWGLNASRDEIEELDRAYGVAGEFTRFFYHANTVR